MNMISVIAALTKSVDALELAAAKKPPPPPPPPPTTVPLTYSAISDRAIRALPPLSSLGPAGHQSKDPTFGSRILRVTDENTSPGYVGRMATVASSAEQNMLNADSTRFYANQAYTMFYALDKSAFSVKQILDPKTQKPLQLSMKEPEWSFTDPDILYFAAAGKLQAYDFKAFSASTLVDIASVIPGYTGGLGAVCASRDEKVVLSCNGTAQDLYDTVIVHDRKSGRNQVINTRNCTIDGAPLKVSVPFSVGIHNVRIDKSGRYARISVGTRFQPLLGVVFILVDLTTGTAAFLDPTNRGGGHAACGYGAGVNGEVPPGDYGPQAMVRSFADVNAYTTLMPGPNPGPYIGGISYLSWNNARPGVSAPALGVDYNYKPNNPYAGEIFAIATDGSKKAWRFAHHRGRHDSTLGFWHYGRATVSQCGRYALFMSNWEKTLISPVDGSVRTDVFLVELV
jgi:hypothetical protein